MSLRGVWVRILALPPPSTFHPGSTLHRSLERAAREAEEESKTADVMEALRFGRG